MLSKKQILVAVSAFLLTDLYPNLSSRFYSTTCTEFRSSNLINDKIENHCMSKPPLLLRLKSINRDSVF